MNKATKRSRRDSFKSSAVVTAAAMLATTSSDKVAAGSAAKVLCDGERLFRTMRTPPQIS